MRAARGGGSPKSAPAPACAPSSRRRPGAYRARIAVLEERPEPAPHRARRPASSSRAEAEARAALNRKLKGRRDRLAKIERQLEGDRARYEELMELMASDELYADQERFAAALGEYNELKKTIGALEDEWLELSTEIEEEVARERA